MIVFFIRRYHDIDHLVPVIFKLQEQANSSLIVLSLDAGYNIWKDPGVIVIKDKLNVRVDYVYNLYMPTFTHRFLSFLLCSPYSYNLWRSSLKVLIKKVNSENFRDFIKQIVVSFSWKFFPKSIDKLMKKYFNSKWAEEFFKQIGAKILIFDWVKSYQNINASLLSAAKKLGIPTVSFPNSVRVWTAESWEKETVSILGRTYLFDYLISPDKNSREIFIKGGIPPEKNYALGSARYCSEWMRTYPQLYKNKDVVSKNQNKKLLKVVYMDGGARVFRDREELINTFRRICNLDFVDFVIKPKPRSDKLTVMELKFASQIVDREISSHNLCKWADVVIMAPSSIYLEVLWQNKVFIYPKFLFERTTIFESMKVGWIVNNYEELENALKTLKDNPRYKPYSNEAVQELFTEVVEGGIKNLNVLEEYKNFIFAKMKKD